MERVYVSLDDSLKQLKAELKREFPATKFSIRRSRGTAYGYVTVSWTDGPTESEVSSITGQYEGSGFDGITDSSYTINHVGADASGNPVWIHHGTRGIHTTRTISPELANKLIAQVVFYWGGIESAPIAIASKWGDGFSLEPEAAGRQAIRDDLRGDLDWYTAIHRASHGHYVRGED